MLAEAVVHSLIPALRPGTEAAAALVRQDAMVGIQGFCGRSFLPTRRGCLLAGIGVVPVLVMAGALKTVLPTSNRRNDLRVPINHSLGPC